MSSIDVPLPELREAKCRTLSWLDRARTDAAVRLGIGGQPKKRTCDGPGRSNVAVQQTDRRRVAILGQ